MQNKEKRILWIVNHTTLREFEVPLLRSLGFEVYTSKLFLYNKGFRSGSADYTLDDHLTIPPEAIKCLNEHNFYVFEMSFEVKKIVNDYFNTAILLSYSGLFANFSANFDGRILIRAFGHLAPMTYSRAFSDDFGSYFETFMKKMKDRIWFAYSYKNIIDREAAYLKNFGVYLPMGVPSQFFQNANTWNGEIKSIFFVCPNIMDLPYYKNIYKNFKKNFGALPHLIGGSQLTAVDDPVVTGMVPRDEFNKYLKNCRVMFYHSEEPAHLHYHPIEAMIVGMPVIYMSKGILGGFDDRKNQPGACLTIREAKNKIKRILNDDWDLIKSIQAAQQTIIAQFTESYIKKIWQTNFTGQAMQAFPQKKVLKKETPQRIAVFLPYCYRGGSLNAAKCVAKMLMLGSRAQGKPVEVIFSCVADTYDLQQELLDLTEAGIEIRETQWKTIEKEQVQEIILANMSSETREFFFRPLVHDEYLIPCDKMTNFSDCDFWLIISDRLMQPIAPIKSFGMVVYDYIQRYDRDLNLHLKDTNYNFIENARTAQFILTTTPQTREDCIQYAGVPAHKVHLTPLVFDPFYQERQIIPSLNDSYFIWTTNTETHKNHLNALAALSYYYENLQGKFNVIITGMHTENFDLEQKPHIDYPYIHNVRSLLKKNEYIFKNRLKIVGNLSLENYFFSLIHAKFLWHPATIDNGTFSVVEAAYYGVPSLSSDYPQMHYINNYFNLNLQFAASDNIIQMAKKLKEMELNYVNQKNFLPSKEFLKQFTYHKLAGNFFETIEKFL